MVVNHTLSQLAMIRRILSWSIPKFRQNAAVPNAYNTRPHLLPLNISYTGFQVAPVNSLFSHRFHPSSYLESFAGGVFRAHHTLTRPRGVTSALSPPPDRRHTTHSEANNNRRQSPPGCGHSPTYSSMLKVFTYLKERSPFRQYSTSFL